jgi:Zn-dependent M28 family amino/carboxypeptidase
MLAIAIIVSTIHIIMQPLWINPKKVVANVDVDPGKLRNDVEYLVEAFVPRDFSYPENLQRMAIYLKKRFEEAGARTELQEYVVDEHKYYNVIASFGPNQGERLIIGAHYDTCCKLPGADDNTSGVAGLLALAPLLAKVNLKQRVDLVAFTLEEPPYYRTDGMGSAQHAKMMKDQNIKVSLMIALEMIGYFTDQPDTQEYPVPLLKAIYPTTGNFIAVVGGMKERKIARRIKSKIVASTDLPVYSINAPAFLPGIDFSDHLNYWQHGFPAVMLTDTAFYRNKHYHTAYDTPEKLDYERMADVIRGVYHFIITL